MEWDGAPRERANCWRLRKLDKSEATCDLWTHALATERRVDINGALMQSRVFRASQGLAWADVASEWHRPMLAKGREEAPGIERVPVV